MHSRIEFGQTRFGDFHVHTFRHTRWQKLVVTGVSIGDRLTVPTREFWSSLASCFDLSVSTLSFLDFAELFHLLRDVANDRVLQYQIRREADGSEFLVGVSDPNMADQAQFVRVQRGIRGRLSQRTEGARLLLTRPPN